MSDSRPVQDNAVDDHGVCTEKTELKYVIFQLSDLRSECGDEKLVIPFHVLFMVE